MKDCDVAAIAIAPKEEHICSPISDPGWRRGLPAAQAAAAAEEGAAWGCVESEVNEVNWGSTFHQSPSSAMIRPSGTGKFNYASMY